MTKYSFDDKYKVVKLFMSGEKTAFSIAKEMGTSPTVINRWVQSYLLNGVDSLKVKRKKRKYSLDFKLDVIKYYLNHNEAMTAVAIKFNINTSQVHSWVNIFNTVGIKDVYFPLLKAGNQN